MYRSISLAGSLLLYISALAKHTEIKADCPGLRDSIIHKFVYTFAEKMPEPIGGMLALQKQIMAQLRYPKSYAGDGPAGRVIVAFVVNVDGTISGGRVLKDPSGTAQVFGKQLLKILKRTKWLPGICGNKKVPVLYLLPMYIDV